jgi:hypothetical protein
MQQWRTSYLAVEQRKRNPMRVGSWNGARTKRLDQLVGAETVRRVLTELIGYVAARRLLEVLLFTGARLKRRAPQ